MICNALKHKKSDETRGRHKIMTPRTMRRVVKYSKKHPFASAKVIQTELGLVVSVRTLSRVLKDNNLKACQPRKVPLLRKIHVEKRLKFAKSHLSWPLEKWRNVLWTDESKIVLYGGTGSRQFVRRPPNSAYSPKYTVKTVKHGGLKIMVWGCFSYYGVGPIYWIKSIMDRFIYVDIMQNTMLPYAEEEMPLRWIFQQDNDPKHTSKLAKKWFDDNKVTVMEWPAQSPDLNPIENLWGDIKKGVSVANPTNINDLWSVIERTWAAIPSERCQSLVNSMNRRCAAVIKNKGYATKY
jgi:hypothetical protein